MNINLKRRIIIKANTESKNEAGTIEQTAAKIITTRALIQPARNREYYESQKVKDADSYKITIRYRSDVNNGMVILYENHIFEIQSVMDPDMQHQYLELYCVERLRGKNHE